MNKVQENFFEIHLYEAGIQCRLLIWELCMKVWCSIKLLSAAFKKKGDTESVGKKKENKTWLWLLSSWKQRTESDPGSSLSLWRLVYSCSPDKRPASHTHGVGAGKATHSSRWPSLSVPLVPPHHWKHCTRSPLTAPEWCPEFPGTHLHSQSRQLQKKECGIVNWGEKTEDTHWKTQ